MRLLITGAAGQIGQELIHAFHARGDEVVAADLRPRVAGAPDEAAWHTLDVTDSAACVDLCTRTRPDAVVHLAAILSARAEEERETAYRVNEAGTRHVLEACRRAGVPNLFFASSIAVFGPGLPQPVGDDAPTRPTTLYGVTKVIGEMLGEYHAQHCGLDFRAIRFPGLISDAEPGRGTSDYAVHMFRQGVRTGRYEAYCRPDTRIPLMYMPDAVRAVLELIDAPKNELRRCVYNIAAMSPTAQELAIVIAARTGAKITFKPDPARQAILDSWPQSLDDRHAREDWGWRPRYDLDAMAKEMISHLQSPPEAIRVGAKLPAA
ncbi:MAG: NAD-dependent epimerase/dehydratase family protein [Planctomycetota bacterium]|nr:NAD-dependent epimerase/dehydratase family protein [Planctomycetota bacterium]